MDAKTLVAHCKLDKDRYLENLDQCQVGARLRAMNLTTEQRHEVLALLDGALTDQLYGLLLGLDGAACIGDEQHDFRLLNEDGDAISGNGELEAEAYAQLIENPR
jgi:hypothetical protein